MKFAIALLILGLALGTIGAPEGEKKELSSTIEVSSDVQFNEGRHPILKLVPSICYVCSSPCTSIYCCNGEQCCYISGFGCACCI